MIEELYNKIYQHLQAELPREACGIIIRTREQNIEYVPANNLATNDDDFILDPECLAYAEDIEADILYIVHTHPRTGCNPSASDIIGINSGTIPWIIMDSTKQVSITRPDCGPLVGREFNYGVADCFSLAVDYYSSNFNIKMPEVLRLSQYWWQDYGTNINQVAENLGFDVVDYFKENDMLLINLNSKIPNHFAIYLGNNKILHHPVGRLSVIEELPHKYLQSITHIFRRKELV